MEPPSQLVDTAAERAVEPGTGIRLAPGQPSLARHQQLTATDPADAGVVTLGDQAVVAAPGQMDRPHLAGLEAEARGSGEEEQAGVQPGAASAVLAGMTTDGEGAALGRPFTQVAP